MYIYIYTVYAMHMYTYSVYVRFGLHVKVPPLVNQLISMILQFLAVEGRGATVIVIVAAP